MAKTSRRARRNSSFYMPGAFDMFAPSKALFLKHIWIFAPLYAIGFIFYIHSWIWQPLPHQQIHLWQHVDGFSSAWPGSTLPAYLSFLVVGFSLLWLILILAAGTIAQIMSNTAQLEAAKGRYFDFNSLWSTVKELGWRLLGLYIVTIVVIAVGFIIIIPGLIFIRRYFLSPYVMIDKKLGIRESMAESAALSKLNPGAIWGILGVMFLIGLLNIVPVIGGLAAFVFGALYSVAPALRYEQIKRLA